MNHLQLESIFNYSFAGVSQNPTIRYTTVDVEHANNVGLEVAQYL